MSLVRADNGQHVLPCLTEIGGRRRRSRIFWRVAIVPGGLVGGPLQGSNRLLDAENLFRPALARPSRSVQSRRPCTSVRSRRLRVLGHPANRRSNAGALRLLRRGSAGGADAMRCSRVEFALKELPQDSLVVDVQARPPGGQPVHPAISRRSERGPMILTSNQSFAGATFAPFNVDVGAA